jgi:hypothetical protein
MVSRRSVLPGRPPSSLEGAEQQDEGTPRHWSDAQAGTEPMGFAEPVGILSREGGRIDHGNATRRRPGLGISSPSDLTQERDRPNPSASPAASKTILAFAHPVMQR